MHTYPVIKFMHVINAVINVSEAGRQVISLDSYFANSALDG